MHDAPDYYADDPRYSANPRAERLLVARANRLASKARRAGTLKPCPLCGMSVTLAPGVIIALCAGCLARGRAAVRKELDCNPNGCSECRAHIPSDRDKCEACEPDPVCDCGAALHADDLEVCLACHAACPREHDD